MYKSNWSGSPAVMDTQGVTDWLHPSVTSFHSNLKIPSHVPDRVPSSSSSVAVEDCIPPDSGAKKETRKLIDYIKGIGS